MATNTGFSQYDRSRVLTHLRSLRASLASARDALMHFKADRVDRDKLEPAARRVDDLMNLFTGDLREAARGPVWIAEILGGVEGVTNPKASAALSEARVDITVLLDAMGGEPKRPQGGVN